MKILLFAHIVVVMGVGHFWQIREVVGVKLKISHMWVLKSTIGPHTWLVIYYIMFYRIF